MVRRRAELREVQGAIALAVVASGEAVLFGVRAVGSGRRSLVLSVLWLVVAAASVQRLRRAWPRWRAAQVAEVDRIVEGRLGREAPDLARLVASVPTSSVREVASRLANHVTAAVGAGVGLRVRDLDGAVLAADEREVTAGAHGLLDEADEAFRESVRWRVPDWLTAP